VFIYNKQEDRKTDENLTPKAKASHIETEPIVIQMKNKSVLIKDKTERVN
jgi:hypothetical protein